MPLFPPITSRRRGRSPGLGLPFPPVRPPSWLPSYLASLFPPPPIHPFPKEDFYGQYPVRRTPVEHPTDRRSRPLFPQTTVTPQPTDPLGLPPSYGDNYRIPQFQAGPSATATPYPTATPFPSATARATATATATATSTPAATVTPGATATWKPYPSSTPLLTTTPDYTGFSGLPTTYETLFGSLSPYQIRHLHDLMTIYLYAELTDTYVPSEIQDIIGEYFDMNAGNPEERRFFQEWFDTQRQERDSSGRDLPELTTIQKLILQYPHIGDMLNHYFDRLKDSLEDDYAGDPFTTDLFFEAHDTFTYLEEYAFYDGRNPNPAKAAEMQRMLDEYSRRYNVAPPPAGSTDRRSLARSGTPRAGPAAEGGLNAFEAYRFNQLAERYLLHKHGRNSPPLSQELRHEFHALILRLPGDERALWLERFNVVVPTSTPGTPTSVPTATLTAYPEDGLNINIVIERFNRHYDGTLGNEPPFSPGRDRLPPQRTPPMARRLRNPPAKVLRAIPLRAAHSHAGSHTTPRPVRPALPCRRNSP